MHLSHNFYVFVTLFIVKVVAVLNQKLVESVGIIIKNFSEFAKGWVELCKSVFDDVKLWLKVVQLSLHVPNLIIFAHGMHLAVVIDFTDKSIKLDVVVGPLPVHVIGVLTNLLNPVRIDNREKVNC